MVDIGNGRKLFMECSGAGSPAVVLISGAASGARESWNFTLSPYDPVHTATYDEEAHARGISELASAVFPSVRQFTRVCAYSRPGTRRLGEPASTLVPQPHPIEDDLRNLRALLRVSHVSGPEILVGHSYGGLIARLYASEYPHEVAGLVLVDASNEFLKTTAGPQRFANNAQLLRATPDGKREGVELLHAAKLLEATGPAPMPAVVLTSDKPPDPTDTAKVANTFGPQPSFAQWQMAQTLLAASLEAKHITATNSGHFIQHYAPALVTDSIHQTVLAVRAGQHRVEP